MRVYIPTMLLHDVTPPSGDPATACHILVLHGLGDSKEGWKPVAPELGLADAGWIFVQAPDRYYDGFSWFPIPGISGPGITPAEHATGYRRSRQLLAELIDHLLVELATDAAHLILMGFSQGCSMAVDQALRSEHRFGGVLGISGFIGLFDEYPDGFGAMAREQTLLMTHGVLDDLLPIERTREQVDRLRSFGVQVEWQEYLKAHGLDPNAEITDLREWLQERVSNMAT